MQTGAPSVGRPGSSVYMKARRCPVPDACGFYPLCCPDTRDAGEEEKTANYAALILY